MSENPEWASEQDEFADLYGEPLAHVLDMGTWRQGADLAELYLSLQRAVAESVEQERRTRSPVRTALLDWLERGKDTDPMIPDCAGVYAMTPHEIQGTHRAVLFNGATECCDGTALTHNSLLLSVVQIGLAMVAYQGSHGTWVQRLYRRDLRAQYPVPLEEVMDLLQRRARRSFDGIEEEGTETVSRLVRRSLMDYAERAALLHFSDAPWRMGHGNPIPNSLLIPATPDLVRSSIETLTALLLDHRQFVFVDSEPADRLLLTLGDSLRPLEFAIVYTLEIQYTLKRMHQIAEAQRGHPQETRMVREFIEKAAPQIVMGVYRASSYAPARVFYAHRDFACEAAAIAMADSALQPHRGFPMLIDLADLVAANVFDSASFRGSVQDAYAAAGEPTRFLGERETRSGRAGPSGS